MPDEKDDRGAEEGERSSGDNSPDIVGEELGDGARIWRVYDRVAREDDRERTGNWNRGLDNLALFAGLFSAVTTAFIIQLQQDTQPDYARLTFLVLNASNAGLPFRDDPFTIDRSVRTTNCLWIASLMLSLTAALIAIMGKDWIAMYESRPVSNLRQWAEIRTHRLACVERWYMSGVIASAPVLLHISLVLFAYGLVIFVARDPFSQRVALGLSLAAGGLYMVTVLSAVIFPTSPFKSPATQAVRGACGSIFTSVYESLVYPIKRRPVALLQQSTLIIGAVLSLSLSPSILPLQPSQRRRLRRVDFRMVWDHLFSRNQGRSWSDTAIRLAKAFWTRSNAFVSSLPVRLRSTLGDYRYRRQRPRPRPWHVSAWSYLRRIDLSDRWSETRSQPTPNLLARSLSHLNAMTQSTDVFHSVLVALGDIAIGYQVAPLVSFDLRTRLATEMRHNWRTVDLLTLSRYVLTDQHLSDSSVMPHYEVYLRFARSDTAIKSESIVFAVVELARGRESVLFSDTYLLPIVHDHEVAIVLVLHYWDQLGIDQSQNLQRMLRAELISRFAWEDNEPILERPSGGHQDLLELLILSFDYLPSGIITLACASLLKVLPGDEKPCLVYAFGHRNWKIADAAWSALPAYDPLTPMLEYYLLEAALPLAPFAPREWKKSVALPVTQGQRAGEVCLVRSIVKLLFPSRYLQNTWPRLAQHGVWAVTTLELCTRCLHTQLHSRCLLSDEEYLEIMTLILDHSVLIRISAVSKSRAYFENVAPTAERDVINILTVIARRLSWLLQSDVAVTAARLFCLFAFSEAMDYKGDHVTWDLRSYLCTISSYRDPGAAVSLRRLLRVLRSVRALCAQHDDLRAAWERIGIAPDDTYHDSFWDAEEFELGPLLDPDSPPAETRTQDVTVQPIAAEEFDALLWLDAAMR